MARFTNQSPEKVYEDSERDYYMNPEAALKYGIIDHIAKPPTHSGSLEKKAPEPAVTA